MTGHAEHATDTVESEDMKMPPSTSANKLSRQQSADGEGARVDKADGCGERGLGMSTLQIGEITETGQQELLLFLVSATTARKRVLRSIADRQQPAGRRSVRKKTGCRRL